MFQLAFGTRRVAIRNFLSIEPFTKVNNLFENIVKQVEKITWAGGEDYVNISPNQYGNSLSTHSSTKLLKQVDADQTL